MYYFAYFVTPNIWTESQTVIFAQLEKQAGTNQKLFPVLILRHEIFTLDSSVTFNNVRRTQIKLNNTLEKIKTYKKKQ